MNVGSHTFAVRAPRRRRRVRWARSEFGAVLTEGAIILPLFLAIIVGVIEVGIMMQHRSEVRESVSAAARKASLSANDANADYLIVQALRSRLGPRLPEVRYAIVFKAPDGASQARQDCVDSAESGGTGVPGVCNVYSNAVLSAPDPTKFGYTTAEPTRTADQNWPARDRSATYSGGRDLVGVQVKASFRSTTGIFPSSSDTYVSVIRLEARGV